MLDIKFVREHLDEVRQMLKNRCNPLNLDDFEGLDKKRRELLQESEALKSQRNTVSKEISVMKKNKEDAEAKILEMRAVGAKISELDKELKDVEAQLRDIMLHIPNMPREDVPIGKDDTENPEVRKWGEPTKLDFEPIVSSSCQLVSGLTNLMSSTLLNWCWRMRPRVSRPALPASARKHAV